MNDVPGARAREADKLKDEDTDAAPLFPSEGTFSAVVPLSEVRAGRDSARDSNALAVASKKAEESEEPRESEEPEEEATLVPSRAGRGRLARRAPSPRRESRRWLAMTLSVVLSVVAGLAAGAYMVWTQQTRRARPPVTQAADTTVPNADAATQAQAAPEAPQPEPAPAEAEISEAEAEVVKVEPVKSPEAPADDTKPATPASAAKADARPSASETASRRNAETEPRAAARERARPTTADSTPAPKPAARREPAPRRQATPERARTSATASRGRALPVSSPPPSARPRTVIQWP